ncbi:MAG: hypothetical protein JRE43_04520 [Deltaproteobacteria bacterium]|nr:hypothetical protein [Deltaproteobacteria bacterium]MBW2540638.1 hypothetical protein [Deltaproteobacteria bacterium]
MIAAAVAGAMALAGFAGAAYSSATIDLIWDATGTNVIDDAGPKTIQLNVILTAGPNGSQGAGVSVDFRSIGESFLVVGLDTPLNTPSEGSDSVLPIEMDFPQIRGSRVELINSVCFCDLGIGTGLEAGQSHQLGYVTFNITLLERDTYEITSDADGPSDGVLDGDANEILPEDVTFNSAFLDINTPLDKRHPRGIRNRRR